MAITTQPAPRQPTQWQAPQQPIPSTARGVPQEAPPPPAPKFVLPRPEALGVSVDLRLAQVAAVAPAVDWNLIQARMERLGVLSYHKVRLPTGAVHVTMTLPGASQPMEAHASTEAVAILAVLQQAEARR
jgi:hypothetical protein